MGREKWCGNSTATGKGTRRERMLQEGTLRYTEVSEGSGEVARAEMEFAGGGVAATWAGRSGEVDRRDGIDAGIT